MNNIVCRGLVGGDGNVIDDGDAQKRLDVGVVRHGLQGIPEKNDDVYFPLRDFGADLLVAAERPRKIAFDLQPRRLRDEFCRRTRAAEVELRQRFFVGERPLYDFVFLVVVRDESDGFFLFQSLFLRVVLFFYYTLNNLSCQITGKKLVINFYYFLILSYICNMDNYDNQ